MKKVLFLLCCMITIPMNAMLGRSLPEELTVKILKNIPLSPWLETVKEVNGVITSLACVNKSWNLCVSNSENTLSVIKKLSKRFEISDMEVTKKLSNAQAKNRYGVQTSALIIYDRSNQTTIYDHLNIISSQLDLNFTYSQCEKIYQPTLLMIAADLSQYYSASRNVIAQWFIDKGADINILNKQKKNALMVAITRLNFELIDVLLGHPQFDLIHVDSDGNTLLHCCIASVYQSPQPGIEKHEKMCSIISRLLEKGIDRQALNKDGKTALDIARYFKPPYEPFIKILDPQYNSQKN